jgi:hypothetical protein
MRPITLFRALAWAGTMVVWSSLVLVRWGDNPNLPAGPPGQWERLVVGAGLLAMLAALAISVSGRKRVPPSWTARGVAAASASAVLFIAWYLRSDALATGFGASMLGGQGWIWLLAGGGMAVGAVAGTFGLKPPASHHKQRKHR